MPNSDSKIPSVDETLDDLILGGMKIFQAARGYRFSLDAVLLANFPQVEQLRTAIDLGTGNGVVAFLLSLRAPQARITGVEIQEAMVERARRGILLNRLDSRVVIIQADIREIENFIPGGGADLVLSNPPFWRVGEGKVSSNQEEAIARHELQLTLSEVIRQGAYLLVPGGSLVIVQRADRLAEALEFFRFSNLGPKRLRLVHSKRDSAATLMLLEGQKNYRGKLNILPPMFIYKDKGEYSEELQQIYSLYGYSPHGNREGS